MYPQVTFWDVTYKKISNEMSEILAKVYRSDCIESVHYGSIVVVDSKGRIVYHLGDPYFKTYFRSTAKPYQVIPLLKSGAIERFGITDKEIAVMVGSHGGEPRHVRAVASILKKIGLGMKHLQCGKHVPSYFTAIDRLPKKEDRFNCLHQNCSGKHAGMLALAVHKGWDVRSYLEVDQPIQKLILSTVSEVCEYPSGRIRIGTDGCGAPIFYMPIYNMALGFVKLALPQDRYTRKVVNCMLKYPEMVSGRNRFDLVLSRLLGKRGVCKVGGEALHCTALLDGGWAVAVKIADGNRRAVPPVVLEVLRQIGILKRHQLAKVRNWTNPQLKNYQNKIVGFIQADFKLRKGE